MPWASPLCLVVHIAQSLVLCVLWGICSVSLPAGTSTHQKAFHPGPCLHRSLSPKNSLWPATLVLLRWAKNSFGLRVLVLPPFLLPKCCAAYLRRRSFLCRVLQCSWLGAPRWEMSVWDRCALGFRLKYYSLKFSVIIWHENALTLSLSWMLSDSTVIFMHGFVSPGPVV